MMPMLSLRILAMVFWVSASRLPSVAVGGLRAADGEWARLLDRCDEIRVPDGGAPVTATPLLVRASALYEETKELRLQIAVLTERARRAEDALGALKPEVVAACTAVGEGSLFNHGAEHEGRRRRHLLHNERLGKRPCRSAVTPDLIAATNLPLSRRRLAADATLPTSSARLAPAGEKAALLILYNATGGCTGCWKNDTGWADPASDPCRDAWHGVQCDGDGAVHSVDLSMNELCGTLPSYFSLERLAYLCLDSNPGLEGTFPTTYGSLLGNVEHLTLFSNPGLKGNLPTQIALLRKLTSLELHSNEGLKGQLPSELGELSNLEELFLFSSPGLSGTIPTTLGDLQKVKTLNLVMNPGLKGQIPSEIGRLGNLEELTLDSNPGLTGTIPSAFGQLISMRELGLAFNTGLEGTLPAHELSGLGNLTTLRLGGTDRLAGGSIPSEWRSLTNLKVLNLRSTGINFSLTAGRNYLKSPFPSSLVTLNLRNNSLGFQAGDLLRSLRSHLSLVSLDISHNALHGRIEDGDMNRFLPDGSPFERPFQSIVSLDLSNNLIERLPSGWRSAPARAAPLLTLFLASNNSLIEALDNETYANVAILDLRTNPKLRPGSLPNWMVFDNATIIPLRDKNCTCQGVTTINPSLPKHSVAWNIDPAYHRFAGCTCNAGYGGERCNCMPCQPGSRSYNGRCESCPGQSYSLDARATTCNVCKPNTCNGHGECWLNAADASEYVCSCDTLYRLSRDCKVFTLGYILAVVLVLVLVLLAVYFSRRLVAGSIPAPTKLGPNIITFLCTLPSRRRRKLLVAAAKQEAELRIQVELAEEDAASLKKGWLIEERDLHFGTVVAHGAFGQVYRGQWMRRAVAIKEIFLLPSDSDDKPVHIHKFIY